MAEVTERPRTPQPAPMPVWPWLVAPALLLLLMVGFSVLCVLLVNRGRGNTEAVVAADDPPAPHDEAPPEPPAAPRNDAPAERPATPQDEPPPAVPSIFPTRRAQPAPDLEVAANAPDAGSRSVTTLPQLSEALLTKAPADSAMKEVPKASPEREALYDAAVQRYVLYDLGRLRGLVGRKAALDFEALGPDAIPALVRGLNRSATLDASCPVVAISGKLSALLADCNDPELLARVRDEVGKGVGITPYAAYLDGIKSMCAARVKKLQRQLKPDVPHLVAGLKAKDPAARRKAANALGLAGAEAKAAVPALVEALKDPDAQVRVTAARALAAIGAPAVPALVKAGESSPDGSVRSLAYLALGEVRPADADASRALVAALKDPDKEIRAAAAFALAGQGDAAVAPLREALRAKDPSAALALGQIGSPAANVAIPELVAALTDENKELRVAAHHALVKIGAPAVPALAAALSGADLRGWYSVSVALGKVGPAARPAAVPALSAGLKHEDKGVRVLAANALAKIDPDNPDIKPVLAEAVPALVEVLQQRDGPLRAWAAVSLGRIGGGAASAAPALTAALADPEAPVRAAAADALGRLAPRDPAALVGLVRAQGDADENVRTAARDALTRLGKSAVPALIDSFGDGGDDVRSASAESLGRIGADAVPDLVTATRADDDRVRRGAVAALARVGPPGVPAVPALVGGLDDADHEVRCGAARALGAIRPEKPAAAEALVKHLHDPDADFRAACREGLVGIGPAAIAPLTTAANDADTRARAAALGALRGVVVVPADGKLDAAGESVLRAFSAGLRDSDGEVRIAAHLGMIRLGRTATPALATALGEKDAAVRRLAAETLQKLGPDAKAAIPDLIAALRDSDAEVRDGAGWVLESLDAELRAALPALRQTLAAPPKPAPVAANAKAMGYRTVAELAALAAGEPGDLARQALRELALRRGEQALSALARAAVGEDRDTRALGREMLLKWLEKRPDDKAEEAASRRLKLARRLLEEGRTGAGQQDVRDLIESQPRTRAAEEARRLLAEAGR